MAQVLDIAPLRSVVAVADCGGFHRAATVLHLTQSAVSQHVRRVEAVVGGPVVEKSGRGVAFTDLGYRVLAHARTILAAHDNALDDLGAAEERVLLVGATEHGADVLLPGLTEALGERLPDRRLRFRLDRNVMLADAIDHGTLDLAVMLDGSGLDPANASGIVALKWISSRTFAVPANEPLPVVMFSEPCTLREPAYAALDRIGVRYRIAAESSDLSGLVRGGALRPRRRAVADDRSTARRIVPRRGPAADEPRIGVRSRPRRRRRRRAGSRRPSRSRRAGRADLRIER